MTPCKDCNKRDSTCHSTCKDYVDWKEELNERNRQKRKIKTTESITEDYKLNIIQKIKKGKRK